MSITRITRRMEFDAGHRIPDHGSKCRNLHGHRYRLEATVEGAVRDAVGEADDGMITDFGVLKQVMTDVVVDAWDHAFIVCADDVVVRNFLECGAIAGHKTVVLDVVPTAENLAARAFHLIRVGLRDRLAEFRLVHVRLYETPNCWADVHAPRRRVVSGPYADHPDRAFYQRGGLSDDGTDDGE